MFAQLRHLTWAVAQNSQQKLYWLHNLLKVLFAVKKQNFINLWNRAAIVSYYYVIAWPLLSV